MRRLALLLAAGSLWLFLAAVPALADGGPHITAVNSGTAGLTADSCAGCHRAHTAQGEMLLAATSEEALCLSCHDGAGATTDVENGVQYTPNLAHSEANILGALRDGGFEFARIGANNPTRTMYIRGFEDTPFYTEQAISTRPKVPVGASEAVKSAHIDTTPSAGDGIADTGRVWGSGDNGTGAGAGSSTAKIELSCASCHNPHGNGQYRILNPVPGGSPTVFGTQVAVAVKATFMVADTIVTNTQNGLVQGDTVTISGLSGAGVPDGDYNVFSVVNGFTFKIGAFASSSSTAAYNITADTTGVGSVVRKQIGVADSNPDPAGDKTFPTKNYTILQTKGAQGVDTTFLLYAKDVVNAKGGTGVATTQSAVNITSAGTIGSGSTVYLKTSGAHGLASGDLVTITGGPWGAVAPAAGGTTYTVGSVSTTGSVYDAFTVVGTDATASGNTGTVARQGIPGDYTAAGGDYFRRTVPWNAKIVNSSCNPTVPAISNSPITAYANNALYCATMNDAPNGQPSTISSGPTTLLGEKAFVDEMSTWCAACHTRYYSASNENLAAPNTIAQTSELTAYVNVIASNRMTGVAYTNGVRFSLPSLGDKFVVSGFPTGTNDTLNGKSYYVVNAGSSSGVPWIEISDTADGDAITLATYTGAYPSGAKLDRTYQSSSSSWGFPRNVNGVEVTDAYKFQHSTSSNRACTVCHVGHGSNAQMDLGSESAAVEYPDGSVSAPTSPSSRLLKVDNRGTCQMCHDPTLTQGAGTTLPTVGYSTTVP